MKILLFGKNGQVGGELRRSLAPLGDVVALARDSTDFCGDLTNLDGLARTIRDVSPDVIVNAAAYTAVDKAESEPTRAQLINAQAPYILAEEAKKSGAWLVHYSTDYVFDGMGNRPWVETDNPSPLNVYGTTKLEGEKAIQQSGCRSLLFRTSWVYATHGNNFAKTMIKLASERESLRVVDDQIGAPTGADLIADITTHAIGAVLQKPEMAGLYHLAAGGQTSWYDYAKIVLAAARRAGSSLRVAPEAVIAISSSDFAAAAKRPLNSRLDTSKLEKAFAVNLPDWRIGVDHMLSEILK